MPIQKKYRHFYGKVWKTITRPRILERARHKCEQCKVPNHEIILRHNDWPGWWFTFEGEAHDPSGKERYLVEGSELPDMRVVKIVLTISHENHTPGDDRDENLKARCQWCHFNHDKTHHHITRATRKDRARPLLSLDRAAGLGFTDSESAEGSRGR